METFLILLFPFIYLVFILLSFEAGHNFASQTHALWKKYGKNEQYLFQHMVSH